MLHARGLSFRFPGAAQPAVAEAGLSLAAGEWLAMAGTSGSGKSTLLRLLSGLRTPDAGSLTLDGVALPAPRARRAWHRQILLLPQDTARAFNPALPLRPQFRAAMALHGIGRDAAARDAIAEAALARCGVHGHALDRHADALSGGQRQRAALARLLCLKPRALLLDEPTAALDPATSREICTLLDTLRRQPEGPALLTATHEAQTLAHADRVLRMRDGRVQNPTPCSASAARISAFGTLP